MTRDGNTEPAPIRAAGDARDALDRWTPLVYEELRRIASRELGRRARGATLQTTALVHEAWLRLTEQRKLAELDRQHFMALAAKVVRRTLVDHARQRAAQARGGAWQRISVTDLANTAGTSECDLLALDDALTRLEQLDARQAQVVELRYFAGLSVDDTAGALGVAPRTVDGDWRVARAWLARELAG
jgi:RNA polymerase sigma factor (TIGR02999 family)